MPDTDPNQVRLTGENSFIRLFETDGGPQLTRVSHWRILYSPGGPGHVLFLQSDVTDNAVKIYGDNEAMIRWLQGEIETLLYAPFADVSVPIIPAQFSRSGDTRTAWTEHVKADGADISLTWSDYTEPFMLTLAAGAVPNRPHGVYSLFVPARQAKVSLNGRVAAGRPFPQMRGDKEGSSACLALSETWVRP
jgi:hypothetical protein